MQIHAGINQCIHKSVEPLICSLTALALLIVTLWSRANTSEKLLEFVSCPYHAHSHTNKSLAITQNLHTHAHTQAQSEAYVCVLGYLYKYVYIVKIAHAKSERFALRFVNWQNKQINYNK